MTKQKIIIITAGSFHGKSVVSLKTAAKLNLSGVLSTDMIRNILNINFPERNYLSTSTYLLDKKKLSKQKNDVSGIIKKMITIYEDRGENIIIEGMHFNNEFLEWAMKRKYCCICLNNELSLSERVILKKITRSKLRIVKDETLQNFSGEINSLNVVNTLYMLHAKRIDEISNEIFISCKKNGYELIEFTSLKDAVDKTFNYILKFYNNNDDS